MALSLFAIFKRELLHYHAELMGGARQHRRDPQSGDTPAKPVQRPGAGRWLSGTPRPDRRLGTGTPPTTHAGLRALEAHLRDDRHNSARGFIGVPCGDGFAVCFDSAGNQKSVDWLIAKRGAEIANAG